MERILFKIGSIPVQTFGVFVALGVLAGLLLARWDARRKGFKEDVVMDFALYAILAGLAGARLFYALVYAPGYYLANPLAILYFHEGGLSIHGGLIGGVLAGIWYVRKHRLSFWRLADLFAPAIALGQAIGRIGCDVFGKPMAGNWPWGVMVNGQLLHPAQVYELLLDFALFFYLWRRRTSLAYNGQLFIHFAVYYALIRGLIEFVRINPVVWGPFTVAHAASLAFIVAAVVVGMVLKKRATGDVPVQEGSPGPLWPQVGGLLAVIAVSIGIYYSFPPSPM